MDARRLPEGRLEAEGAWYPANTSEVVARPSEQAAAKSLSVGDWRILSALGLAFAGALALYWPTAMSMVDIWARSETFAHCFIIAPISLYLVWRRRAYLSGMQAQPSAWGLALLAGIGFVWLVASLAGVQVGQQLAFVAILSAIVIAILGLRVARAIAFPLAFLFFAVPVGETLIPPLMDLTAVTTVQLLRLTGIPVYVEGTFFSIPSGDWSVVEGCSGVRYLIASVTLGCVYAYISYRSTWRRLAFIAVSVATPIVANALRAYLIVMIAHLSNNKLAHGIDHFIYGWVFFGLVMLLMFWIGSFWSEDTNLAAPDGVASSSTQASTVGSRPVAVVTLATVAILAVWPAWAAYSLRSVGGTEASIGLEAPVAVSPWRLVDEQLTDWRPEYQGPGATLDTVFEGPDGRVAVLIPLYLSQQQDAELINSRNIMIRQKHPIWRQVENTPHNVFVDGLPATIVQTRLRSASQNLLIWRWHWLGGHQTASDHEVKVREALARLLGQNPPAADIILYTNFSETGEVAAQRLAQFAGTMMPSIRASLEAAVEAGGPE